MIQRDSANAQVVHDAIAKYAPTALASLAPDPMQVPNILAAGGDPWQSPRYAQESLKKKLKVIGLSMDIPAVPSM